MRSKFLLAVIGLTLGWLPAAPAQSQDQVEARIRFISMTRPLMGVGLVNDGKPMGIVIPTDMFSDGISYRGPARLELLKLSASESIPETPPAPEGKKQLPPAPRRGVRLSQQTTSYKVTGEPALAWIDLPKKQGLLHLIILVTPGQGNGMAMLNDKPGSFPPGSNRYLNLCAFPLKIKAPSGEYDVAAGVSQTLRPGALDKTYYDLQLLTRDARVMFSTRVYHLESARKLYVLSQVGSAERVQLKAIVDRPPSVRAEDLEKAKSK
jgi:hypothetical protein